MVSFVVTVSRMLPPRLQATGQTLLAASAFGAGAILANLLGGVLYGLYGPNGAFGFAAACSLAGALVALAVVPSGKPAPAWQAIPIPEPVPD
jgi:MFS family permease